MTQCRVPSFFSLYFLFPPWVFVSFIFTLHAFLPWFVHCLISSFAIYIRRRITYITDYIFHNLSCMSLLLLHTLLLLALFLSYSSFNGLFTYNFKKGYWSFMIVFFTFLKSIQNVIGLLGVLLSDRSSQYNLWYTVLLETEVENRVIVLIIHSVIKSHYVSNYFNYQIRINMWV